MSTLREQFMEREKETLSQYAFLTANSKGRDFPCHPCNIRTPFQRDRDRIIHSNSFRRLMYKTQVFLAPTGDHYRTRMTHTLEVAQIARIIARALRLNEDLTEAIALGHDLGHTPFGHSGEDAMREYYSKDFAHYKQSLRVVELLENNGKGLNLSHEVRLGILGHTGTYMPETMEGQVVRHSDRFAYVNHDIDDAIRAGILTGEDIPKEISDVLGTSYSRRINTLVCDMVQVSREAGCICLSPKVEKALLDLRSFMFERVYRNPIAKGEESKAQEMLTRLYEYYIANPQQLPEDFQPQLSFDGMERTVCDYIAGMTDKYAVDKYSQIFIPMGWQTKG